MRSQGSCCAISRSILNRLGTITTHCMPVLAVLQRIWGGGCILRRSPLWCGQSPSFAGSRCMMSDGTLAKCWASRRKKRAPARTFPVCSHGQPHGADAVALRQERVDHLGSRSVHDAATTYYLHLGLYSGVQPYHVVRYRSTTQAVPRAERIWRTVRMV